MIDVSNYSMFFKDIVRDKKAWTITSSDMHFKQEVKDHLNIMIEVLYRELLKIQRRF